MDNIFTIKEASKILDCSTQNIYRQKEQLVKLGYMEQKENGSFYITENGINFLKEKRIETIKANNQDFNQVVNQNIDNTSNAYNINNNEIINLLKEQLQDIKNEKEYWKKQAELKDQELKEKNFYIQELNTKAFTLLGTSEQNKQHQENIKKSFWSKFFK